MARVPAEYTPRQRIVTSCSQKAVAQYPENDYSVALGELMSDYYSDNYPIDIELTSRSWDFRF